MTLGLLLLPSTSQAQDKSTLPLAENFFPQLKPILEAAVKQSPRMISRAAENAIAEQNRIGARAPRLPSAGGFLSYNPWQRDDRADLPAPTDTKKFFYNFSITQPVFHWGALASNARLGELQLKITQGQTAEAYRMLVLEIRSLYLSAVLRKMILTRSQLNLGISQDQLTLAQSKFEKKVISESDLFGPRLTYDQAVLAVDRATEDFDVAKNALAKLSGTPVLSDSQIADDIPSFPAAQEAMNAYLAKYTAQSEPRSFSLTALHDQVEIEKLNYKIAATRLKPKVNAVVGTSQDEQSYTSNIAAKYKVQSTYVGVQVSWSIFDGFAAHSAKAISLLRRRQAEQSYDDAVTTLNTQVRSSVKQLGFSARSMEIAGRVLGSAEGYLHGRQDDAKRGVASDSDVNAARLGYVDAQLNAFNARFDYLIKSQDFLSMILEDPAIANLPYRSP
ncbi:MAG: outer rane efflux protein [Verrucomicrobia bacterium]|nr:outer rane efflux protein [Verrucomicrobiota bacterium]